MPALALFAVAVWLLVRAAEPGTAEVVAVAFLAAYGLTPFIRRGALRGGAVDVPDSRKRHGAPTPRMGGVAVVGALVLALGRQPLHDPQVLSVALCAMFLMFLGALDDTRGVSSGLRLSVQVLCALAVIAAGVRLHLLPGPGGAAIDVVLSILWIVGITNAYNFIDGLDGLAACLGALIALLLAIVAGSNGQGDVQMICLAMTGALLGFLPHNLRPNRPATIFLGDSGSASVGFLLASLAIVQDWAENDPLVALAAPILIFSVLIYDMIQTTVSRIATGRVRSFRQWIDYVGRDHIHHRFQALLGGPRRALLLILVLALGLGLSALGLRRGSSGEAILFLVHGALVLLVVAVLEGAASRARRRRAREREP
ncbi:MAG: glycosyltransferase family 4 protein [Acidobacteriota bacterium]